MGKPKFEPHPESVPGDFYVVNGECVTCGYPHVLAPSLIGWVDSNLSHCKWKKQPASEEELEQALAVIDGSEVQCHRYCGSDPALIARIGREQCDYPDGEGS